MSNTTLQEDLAYVRDLADAGQQAPLLGGRFLAFWGALVSIAYFLHFAISSDLVGWPDTAFAWVWGGFIAFGLLGQALLILSIRDKPGSHSVGNRSEATVWMAGGFALFVYFATLIVKSIAQGTPAPGFEASLPIVFAIYGIGLVTTGVMGKTRILTIAGYGALTMVAVAIWFEGAVTSWAVASIGAFATIFLPGLAMMRREPRSVV